MKAKHDIIFMIFILFFQVSFSYALELPEAKVTAKVIDENGKPISGEEVAIAFQMLKTTENGRESVLLKGFTDASGSFTAAHATTGIIACRITKDGYYKSYAEYRFARSDKGRWQPWNPQVELVFRRIEKPVPMYIKELDIEIPITGKEVGFDLIEYDWVPPHGKGKHSDFIFKLDKKFKSRDEFDATLTVTFSDKFDGIQAVKENLRYGSTFKLPRYAPKGGYQKKLTLSKKTSPGKPITDDYGADNNYVFRVRSEDKDGKFYRAMYGKILGEIRFDPMMSKTAYVLFEYYLNPDYTKNLEHGQNLFKSKR